MGSESELSSYPLPLNEYRRSKTELVVEFVCLNFKDGIREVQKYTGIDIKTDVVQTAQTDAVIHMRLFRAQRNLYICGFALLLWMYVRWRLCPLFMHLPFIGAIRRPRFVPLHTSTFSPQ